MRVVILVACTFLGGCFTANQTLGSGKEVWVSMDGPLKARAVFYCTAEGGKPACLEAEVLSLDGRGSKTFKNP